MRAVYVRDGREVSDQGEAQPQAGLERADIRQRVWQAAAGLPARHRRVILLRELEYLSYAQIGARMHLPEDSVRKLLHEARLRFRRAYSAHVPGKERKERCRRLGHLLSGYHDDELRGVERRRVAEHLAECADCRRVLENLSSTSELITTLVPTPAPPGLAERLFSQTAVAGLRPLAGRGGTIWRLPLMLLVGGGFIAGVVVVVALLWQDGGSANPIYGPPLPTATATPTPTPAPTRVSGPAPVLTAAATLGAQETITATPKPKPSPASGASPTPGASLTPAESPTPEATPTLSPSPSPSPSPEPTPSPTLPPPTPSPGSVQGQVTCQGQGVVGAQVAISQGGQVFWSGVTGAGGTFSSGLILDAGPYVVSIVSSGEGFDSAMVTVPAGGYGSVAAECTTIYGPGFGH